ncbi:hypothetical protein AB2L27_00400 [Kineococcus sp. LSe6-4]|uniref:Uncharacterized protein n=1 Tax=Kineococcus halophytocola TaxID=3234027 RepID=A0ABV4GWI3_9ACTN
MSEQIELIGDGDGLAVIGDAAAVDRFLTSAGVPSRALRLDQKLGPAVNAGSGLARAGSQIAGNSGRWVKLTEESARALKLGGAMKGSSGGVSRAVATTKNGKITKILEFTGPGSAGALLTNPAVLAGAAGIMAQLALQQAMDEVTEYLEVIDEKVDDVLRAQKDAAVAEMIGVGVVIDDALLKREHVGRVSEVTWSTLHGAAQSIATTQAYALRQLDALAEKVGEKSRIGKLDRLTGTAEATVAEWLAVLARCFQLLDGLAVLELDRVLDSTPDDVESHRAAIRAARAKRRDLIARSTSRLLSRMEAAAVGANQQALLHPLKVGRVVRSGNEVAGDVLDFHETLGITGSRRTVEAKPWREAVGEARDGAVGITGRSAKAVGRLGAKTFDGARAGTGNVVEAAADRLPWRRGARGRWGVPEDDTTTRHEPGERPTE